MERWVLLIDGRIEGHTETEQKAWRKAFDICESCYYQDEDPHMPQVKVFKEVLEDEEDYYETTDATGKRKIYRTPRRRKNSNKGS